MNLNKKALKHVALIWLILFLLFGYAGLIVAIDNAYAFGLGIGLPIFLFYSYFMYDVLRKEDEALADKLKKED